jgi:hypothetical protein
MLMATTMRKPKKRKGAMKKGKATTTRRKTD